MAEAPTPIPEEADDYEVLGLPRRLRLDPRDLDRALLRLSRDNHPDRFAAAGPDARAVAERNSARVNDAVRTLRDPISRAEYLLALEGVERPEGEAKCPPDLVMEVFELRERAAEDPGEAVRAEAAGLLTQAELALSGLFDEHDEAPNAPARREVLGRIRAALDRRKFLAGLDREVRQALG